MNAIEIESAHGLDLFGSRGITLVRGEGARVQDSEGRTYIDATSMYGTASLGHAHPALARAIAEQARTLVSCFGSWANDRRALLLERLARLMAPLDRIFLCNSGTEAVEAALKFARATTGRPGVVAAWRGFHGRTLGALSATHGPRHREGFEPLLAGFRHVPFDDAAALEGALGDDVGAVILEPVQGEGGVFPASPGYLLRAQELCRARGALLVLDEVQSGCGRTGKWCAYEHEGIEPDLVCLAKGIAGGVPLGAVAVGPRVPTLGPGRHGTTFGGNPLACAAALCVLDVMEEEGLLARAAGLGAWVLDRLRSLESPRIREVRGKGLLIGIELKERSAGIQKALQERGVLVLGAGPNVIRLLPPLTIAQAELEQVVLALAEVLR